jgi:hypothetical protein
MAPDRRKRLLRQPSVAEQAANPTLDSAANPGPTIKCAPGEDGGEDLACWACRKVLVEGIEIAEINRRFTKPPIIRCACGAQSIVAP